MREWGYGRDLAVDASFFFLAKNARNMFNQLTARFSCSSCMSCQTRTEKEEEEEEEDDICRGCESMEYHFPNYTDFDPIIDSPEVLPTWQHSILFGVPQEDSESDGDYHLQKRIPGKATLSPKLVNACGTKVSSGVKYLYPAFPASARNPWDGIK